VTSESVTSKSTTSVTNKRIDLARHPALVASIVTGLCIGTSYIPFPPWAILFGLVPLALQWVRMSSPENLDASTSLRAKLRSAFFVGWLAQFILNLIGFHWIAYTAVEFGHFPWWAGVLVLIAFASIAHLYYGLAGVGLVALAWHFRKLQKRGRVLGDRSRLAAGFLLFALIESLWPSIFPWHLGYTWLWMDWPGAQFADVIGFEGLNLVTLLANALFALAWLTRHQGGSRLHAARWAGAAMSVFLLIQLLGLGRSEPWKQASQSLKVLAIQGNVGNYDKLIAEHNADFARPLAEKYTRLSAHALDRHPEAQLLIWPETAVPGFLENEFRTEAVGQIVRQFVKTRGVPVVTGAYSFDRASKTSYNGFFVLDQDGEITQTAYRKSILIPFGERFPFSDIIPYQKWLFPGLGSFGPGPGPTAMNVVGIQWGPQICLESLYPWFTAGLAKKGAQVISNVTNDSWFGKHFEPYQHLYMTLARAIEVRRPLVRSTNTGITTVILADGKILPWSPIDKEWFELYEVPYQKSPALTIYTHIAGYSPWLLSLALLALMASAWFRPVNRVKTKAV
jgi:apolipoprotein N-acyltransferase